MDAKGAAEDETAVSSAEASHGGGGFVVDMVDPEDSHTGSDTRITNSERTLCNAGYSELNHNRDTTCREPVWPRTEHAVVQVADVDMDTLGLLFDQCIQEVSRLQTQRDELIQELLDLRQPMVRAVEYLRRKRGDARRSLTLAQLDIMAVHEEVQRVKKGLFSTARDCIQNQVKLAAQEYEVAQFSITQEELQTQIQSLTQELSQLRESHQNQLNAVQDQARRPRRCVSMMDVSQCRRASLSLQRRLSGSLRAVEGWYEPRLMALLKRSQLGEATLRKYREQSQDLRVQLGPLRQERQSLELQRHCLEERLALRAAEREENTVHYKETVETLEDTVRDVKMELDIQRKSKEDLERLTKGLLSELNFLRGRGERSVNTSGEP